MENLMLMNGDSAMEIKKERIQTNTVENTNDNGKAMNNSDVKALLGGLKNDGIIISEDYIVEIRSDRLFVDGVEQSDAVNDKYKKYFEGKADIIIKEHKVK